jgi:hypothetical protein
MHRRLLAAALLTLAGCAAEFSPASAEPIDVIDLISLRRLEPLDHMVYCGSDADWHYFFHSKLFQSETLKVPRSDLDMSLEHPVTKEQSCVLVAGRFDTTQTGSWVYVPSAKEPPSPVPGP